MKFRVRLHPEAAGDLARIAAWVREKAGAEASARRLAEIETVMASLRDTPHRGTLRGEIAPGLRALPAGRKAVVVFAVDDERREVLVYAVAFGGADWEDRARRRR